MDDKLHEQRGEFASMQGPEPTEGADRKEQRKRKRKRERERESARRPSRSGALLGSIFIPLINSILVVHRSFIRAPTSRSHSFFALTSPLALPLCLTRARKHARSFIPSLSDHRLYRRRSRPLSPSLSSRSHSRTGHVAPTRSPFLRPATSFPFSTPFHSFSFSTSYQSDTSAAL